MSGQMHLAPQPHVLGVPLQQGRSRRAYRSVLTFIPSVVATSSCTQQSKMATSITRLWSSA
eukprot:71042-Pleurochrysis_carterae.AAC.1